MSAELVPGGQTRGELQEGRAGLERVGHRRDVDLGQQVVVEVGADVDVEHDVDEVPAAGGLLGREHHRIDVMVGGQLPRLVGVQRFAVQAVQSRHIGDVPLRCVQFGT